MFLYGTYLVFNLIDLNFASLVSIKDQDTISVGAKEVAKKSIVIGALQCQGGGCKGTTRFFLSPIKTPAKTMFCG